MRNLALRQDRQNLATSHADDPQLGGFFYSITLGAWGEPRDLSKRAARVLQAFAVLNRSGSVGFIGSRATNGALAAFVERVTGGAASVSTVQRGLGELVRRGYLAKSSWGGGEPRQCKNKRTGEVYWIRDQRAVYTLTAQALAVWAKPAPKSSKGSPAASAAGSAPRPPASKVGNDSTGAGARRAGVFSKALPTSPHVGQSEAVTIAPSDFLKPFGLDKALENTPARRAPAPVESLPTFEAGGRGAEPAAEAAGIVERAACERRGTAEAAAEAAAAVLFDTDSPEEGNRKTQANRHRERPGLRGTKPHTRSESARLILATLITTLERHGRAGKLAIGRAALELGDPRAPRRSGIDWEYWLARWPSMSGPERRSVARSTLKTQLITIAPAPEPPPAAPAARAGSSAAPAAAECYESPPPPPENTRKSLQSLARLGWSRGLLEHLARQSGIEDWTPDSA